MNPTYKSWVPSVAGRLSFRLAGDGNYPTRAIWRNVSFDNSRKILAFQKRRLSDHVFFLPAWRGETGNFWFLCIADCEEHAESPDASLEGRVFLFIRERWKQHIKTKVRCAHDHMSCIADPEHPPETKAKVVEALTTVSELSQMHCEAYATFRLQRDGEFALSDVHRGSETNSSFQDDKLVASQMFFFMKDIVHRHQHHEASTDTLIGLYKVDNADDTHWRRQVIYSLFYQVIDGKRSKSNIGYGNSLGIISYAEAFKKACLTKKSDLPVFSEATLKSSILAAQDTHRTNLAEDEKRSDQTRNFLVFFVGVVFSTLSLIGALSQQFSAESVPPPTLLAVTAYLYMNLDVAVVGLLFATWIVFITFFRNPFHWRRLGVVRNLARIALAFPQHPSGIALIILSVAIAAFSVYAVGLLY